IGLWLVWLAFCARALVAISAAVAAPHRASEAIRGKRALRMGSPVLETCGTLASGSASRAGKNRAGNEILAIHAGFSLAGGGVPRFASAVLTRRSASRA